MIKVEELLHRLTETTESNFDVSREGLMIPTLTNSVGANSKCGWRTHIDIKGPLPVKGRRAGSTSKADAVYAVIFTDDKSRRRVVKHLSNLKNLHRHVSEYIDHAERFGHVCRIFRFDQQFNTEAMGELQTERKFQIECSAAYCQSQDGVAEAGMKQWQKACRAILRDQNRDHVHWTDASNMLIKTLLLP